MQDYQNIKIFLLNSRLQIGKKKFLLLKTFKILYHVISDLKGE